MGLCQPFHWYMPSVHDAICNWPCIRLRFYSFVVVRIASCSHDTGLFMWPLPYIPDKAFKAQAFGTQNNSIPCSTVWVNQVFTSNLALSSCFSSISKKSVRCILMIPFPVCMNTYGYDIDVFMQAIFNAVTIVDLFLQVMILLQPRHIFYKNWFRLPYCTFRAKLFWSFCQ